MPWEKKERVRLLDEEIQRIGVEITNAESVVAMANAASQRAETAKKVYQAMFERAENFQNMAAPCVEYVGILERASFAVEQVQDWKPPLILGGVSGAALGLAGGLVIKRFHRDHRTSQAERVK